MSLQKEKNKWEKIWKSESSILLLVCFILAFSFLTFCSRSSFLYSYNNWDDANSYFSMGKFMMNGGVIYRDLYDQKGPYLYLLYGIAYLLSERTFLGVFFLEILAHTGFLYFAYKIFRLYCTPKISYVLLPVLSAATLCSLSFYWGGAAEEFCLPLLMASLYGSLKYFKQEYPNPPSFVFILVNGMLAGIIMQVKYTMLGFYFAWMAAIALLNLFSKHWKKTILACMVFLTGMFLTMLPWLLYFGARDALDDWYRCYVYNNVFLYSDLKDKESGILIKIYEMAKILYNLIWDNFSYFLFILIGFYYLLFSKMNRWYEKINVLFLFSFLFLGIYIGGANIFYYSIPLMIFAAIGVGAVGRGILKIEQKMGIYLKGKKTFYYLGGIFFLICLFAADSVSMNREYRKLKKEEHFLYEFKEVVEQEENPTLLNVNMLDAGLYTVTGIVPSCEYFQTNGIALDTMVEEQNRYIKEGRTQFVISRFSYPEDILEKYELVKEASFATDGKTETPYYLFRLKK